CYTSGTTGEPKGVAYSHRSATLSAMCMSLADMIGGYRAGSVEAVMPIAALFHGNGWQMPYTAPMNGHRLVLPGRAFEPDKILELVRGEQVTIAAAVPTVWMTLLDHLDQTGGDFGELRAALVAGSRPPPSMVDTLRQRYGLQVSQTWGMTEALGVTKATVAPGAHDTDGMTPIAQRQGRTNYLTRLKTVDDAGAELPRDGQSVGRLLARGPYVAGAYLKEPGAPRDWLDTGDLARIFPDGSVEIVDRLKDVIKSGGEWISSLQLEAAATGHPAVLQAAAVGVAHPKWQERPVLAVVRRPGAELTEPALREFMAPLLASWWMPDRIVFFDSLPVSGTGKVEKRRLRTLLSEDPGAGAGASAQDA
ncbi:MAG: AMP-binding protein, partial [Burkholderiaceae bacterium]